MTQPLAIDLYCGLGGWTEGLLAEGYRVVGFDLERHDYGDGKRYLAQLVLQDVMTLHGRQFKDAALIVASPPCQEFSYMAMPWSRAKGIAAEYRSGVRDVKKLTALFDACFRIQREAIEAAGHFIPLVVENVRGAQAWVGRARWNFGSYYLWGDVPALMPITMRSGLKLADNNSAIRWEDRPVQRLRDALKHDAYKSQGMNWSDRSIKVQDFTRVAGRQSEGSKTVGHVNQREGYSHTRHLTNQAESDGIKHGGDCFNDPSWAGKQGGTKQPGIAGHGSKSNARKAASAQIAKIPFALASWIAWVYKPKN